MDFGFEQWENVREALEETDEFFLIPVLCMAIDHVAEKYNVESIDLIDKIRPMVKQVNEMADEMFD